MSAQPAPQGKKLSTLQIMKQLMQYLRNAAPQEFEAFIRGFDLHYDEMARQCVHADASEIMTAKGRAMHAQFMLDMMEEVANPPQSPSTP
jgi:hypothetical protein